DVGRVGFQVVVEILPLVLGLAVVDHFAKVPQSPYSGRLVLLVGRVVERRVIVRHLTGIIGLVLYPIHHAFHDLVLHILVHMATQVVAGRQHSWTFVYFHGPLLSQTTLFRCVFHTQSLRPSFYRLLELIVQFLAQGPMLPIRFHETNIFVEFASPEPSDVKALVVRRTLMFLFIDILLVPLRVTRTAAQFVEQHGLVALVAGSETLFALGPMALRIVGETGVLRNGYSCLRPFRIGPVHRLVEFHALIGHLLHAPVERFALVLLFVLGLLPFRLLRPVSGLAPSVYGANVIVQPLLVLIPQGRMLGVPSQEPLLQFRPTSLDDFNQIAKNRRWEGPSPSILFGLAGMIFSAAGGL